MNNRDRLFPQSSNGYLDLLEPERWNWVAGKTGPSRQRLQSTRTPLFLFPVGLMDVSDKNIKSIRITKLEIMKTTYQKSCSRSTILFDRPASQQVSVSCWQWPSGLRSRRKQWLRKRRPPWWPTDRNGWNPALHSSARSLFQTEFQSLEIINCCWVY